MIGRKASISFDYSLRLPISRSRDGSIIPNSKTRMEPNTIERIGFMESLAQETDEGEGAGAAARVKTDGIR